VIAFLDCGRMERVWEELMKIETEAELIRSEAQSKAKGIVKIAEEEAEKLIANSKKYATEVPFA
jgi:F0F1-type ATP synthase membrane subunit b/b'